MWRRKEFQSFRVTRTIHVGAIQEDIPEDDVIEFDGFTLRWRGEDHPGMKSLQGGFKMGWIVPEEDLDSVYVPQPAGVQVRPAITGDPRDARKEQQDARMATVSEEDTYVSSFRERTADAQQKNLIQPQRTGNVSPDRISADVVGRDTIGDATQGMEIVSMDNQGSVVVSSGFKTSVKGGVADVTKTSSATMDKKDLSRRSPDLPGKAAADQAEIRKHRGEVKTPAKPANLVRLPNGSDWDMGVQWKRRAALAVEKHGQDPDMLEAIWSVESPGVKKHLEQHM